MTKPVSETYNLFFCHMDDTQWKALAQIYERLPEFMGWHDNIPYWFGVEEDTLDTQKICLWASAEPGGLLVKGHLEAEDWIQWQRAFSILASAAVGFPVKPAEDEKSCE